MGKPYLLISQLFLAASAARRALICALITLFLIAAWTLPANAVEVPSLYTTEVALDKKARDPRMAAYETALVQVLARVSGSELSRNFDLVEALFPNPDEYVVQYRPAGDDTLWVSFDGRAIERVLRDAGQIVWGYDRPLTMVWLAVDWGRGQREIIAADDHDSSRQRTRSIDRNRLLRERVQEIAHKRGLPVAFPLLDTTDLQSVSFSDIWGGFDARVVDASKRYDANSVLIGRVRPSSSQQNRWTYVFGGEERAWTGSPETIIGQIADLMAAELAVGGNAPKQMIALNVSGIDSVDAYGSVQQLLDGVSLIENLSILQVAGDTISYQVEVRGGASRLRRALRFAGLIEEEAAGGSGESAPALAFFYSP